MSGDSAYATAPFDHAKADIILRSSDNINFRVFKLFLSLASPFFEALFDIPQPAQASKDQEIKDGLAVIPMTEDSKTLNVLLRFCYPCTLAGLPNLEGFQDALNIFYAAKKYSLDAIEKIACQVIMNPKMLEAEPLRCFAVAHQERLHEETLLAAKYSLTQPLVPSWLPEIGLISTRDLLSLLSYHRKCGDAVYALRLTCNFLSWIPQCYRSSDAYHWLSNAQVSTNGLTKKCICARASRSRYSIIPTWPPPQWWEDFMDETFTLLQDKPCKETIQASAEKTVRAVKSFNCPVCSTKITGCMCEFSELFSRKVEETVSHIELVLDF